MGTNKPTGTFRAFRNRNYALFFCGQSVSQIGTWMQRAAVTWVVYTITHSAFMVGLTIFAQQFPSFLLSLFGGIVSDRYSRYKILLVTQTASMLQAMAMAALALTGHLVVWQLLTLSVVLGVINAFDVPARQPMVHDMVNDKADLPNALALNSAMVNIARVLGPVLSMTVLQLFGAGICFVSNAVSFLAVLASLVLMKFPPYKRNTVQKKAIAELAEGFAYLKRTPAMRGVILLISIVSLTVFPYDTLVPVFAKVVFQGNAKTFGYISSCMGLGAITGTLFLASLKKGADLKIVLLVNCVVLSISLMIFSRTAFLPLALSVAVVCGFGMMSLSTISITLIQVNAAPDMRGRMMSYVALGFFGMLPIGSIIVGAVSQRIGAPDTMLCQGIIGLVIAVAFSPFLRRDKLNKAEMAGMTEVEKEIAEKV